MTIITRPVKSGICSGLNVDRGGNACARTASWLPIFACYGDESQVNEDGSGENENVEASGRRASV